ncbi:Alpha/Beta hydrolase protein [Gautieria morchelliformis]|nr:Alpha/Beta hydrolase protein [Gautieria morchelliformis]
MAFTAENIGASCVVDDLALSPDGTRLVYRVGAAHRSRDYHTSSLWYTSDVTAANSAGQLTSGLYDDRSPSWHPDVGENRLYFLSDRHKKGGPKQIYTYALDSPGEPHLISDNFLDKKRAVTRFQISPDGRYIAFCSAEELDQEQECKLAGKDDAQVWGENLANACLRLYTISTRGIRTLVKNDKHVTSFTWSPDSKELLYICCDGPEPEFQFGNHFIYTALILPPHSKPVTKHLIRLEYAPASSVIWPSQYHREFFDLYKYVPKNHNDAMAVYRHSLEEISPTVSEDQRFYLGKTEDPFLLIDLRSDSGEFAVGVAAGMDTRVDILNRDGKICALFETSKREAVDSFDVRKVENEYVMAGVCSSGPDKEAPNVWVGKSSGKQSLVLTTKISSHFAWTTASRFGPVERFEWTGEDGISLDGLAWFPRDVDPLNIEKPLPTILHIHGGPYDRETPNLYPSQLSWQPVLAEQGFLVLSPNYRGGSGRGHAFARIAPPPPASTTAWSDVNTMVDEAVKRGLADKDKLAIGGWSFGGYLAAWGVSQTKNKFQCGVMGAGLSDWSSRATHSDIPDAGNEIGGAAPWINTTLNQMGDPIRCVEDIETAMLVVHGECDNRVPVGQGIGFHRGLRRMSKYPDRHSLVIYPREGHTFVEQKHVEDLIRRVIAHYVAWLH